MKTVFVMCLVLGLVVACKKSDKSVAVTRGQGIETTILDFTKIQGEKDSLLRYDLLPFSEIADSMQVIRLETGDHCLVDGKAEYWLEDSLLVVIQPDQIMTFDREGRFLRTVARYGRAPEEFGKYQDVRVKNGKVYIMDDFGKGKVFNIHADEGFLNFQGSTEDFWYNSFLPLDSGRMMMAPFKCEKSKNLVYIQDSTGKYLEGIPCPPNRDVLAYNGLKLVSQVGQEYYYTPFTCDTIFQIVSGNLLPKWIFKVGKRQEVSINGETTRYLYLTVKTIQEQNTSNSVTYTTFSTESYRYDKADKKLSIFNNVWDDRFASIYRNINDLHFQNGEWFYRVYSASMLTESIPQILQAEIVDDKIKEGLKKLQGNLSMDDNPILVVGRLK